MTNKPFKVSERSSIGLVDNDSVMPNVRAIDNTISISFNNGDRIYKKDEQLSYQSMPENQSNYEGPAFIQYNVKTKEEQVTFVIDNERISYNEWKRHPEVFKRKLEFLKNKKKG